MDPGDLDAVLAIERHAFPDPWPRRFFEQELAGRPPACATVVAHDGQVIGYLVAWFVADEVHLGNLAVCEPCRRRGAARLLLDDLVTRALAVQSVSITLEVRATNRAAIALYARNHFRPIGIRKGYYRGKEDAILMTRDLQPPRES